MSERFPTAIAVIGAGVMGEALISALIASGINPRTITVSEKREGRAEELKLKYDVEIAGLAANVGKSDVILLVVKPQDMSALLTEIKPFLLEKTLLISFAAGKKIQFVIDHVGAFFPVIRVMPNTPVLVGAGMSAMSMGSNVLEFHRTFVQSFLGATGRVVEVDETLQDAVTAVSGSGPAYFFAFVEAMISAGAELGLSPEIATELTVQTLIGAAALLASSTKSATELRVNVTSPNGTTAAALKSLSESGLAGIVKSAMTAARDRSQELA
jgi:pyrroline-5-carboxylate reductase